MVKVLCKKKAQREPSKSFPPIIHYKHRTLNCLNGIHTEDGESILDNSRWRCTLLFSSCFYFCPF